MQVAGAVDHRGSRQRQVFKVQTKGIAAAGLHQIGAFVGQFAQRVTCGIDNIDIVAVTTGQRVIAVTAIQRVIARATQYRVRTVARVDRIIADAPQHGIVACIGIDDVIAIACVDVVGQRCHARHFVHADNRGVYIPKTMDEIVG